MGASAGFTFLYVGLERRLEGRSARAALIAAWTSRAAPLMSRSSPNCSVIRVDPTVLDDVISLTSAICPRCRSSGVATLVASTSGSGDTGNWKKATAPAAATPNVSKVVATGRRMNSVDGLMARPALHRRQ